MRDFGFRRAVWLSSFTMRARSQGVEPIAPLVGESVAAMCLPFALSVIAGSVDVIGFLALDGLFTAHITGNIVMIAARFVAGEQVLLSHVLALPVFMLVLGLTRLVAASLERARIPSLLPLLLLELALLSAFFAFGIYVDAHTGPNAASTVVAGMLGVAAMAVQNALVRISLTGAPSTAPMTTNLTVLTIDLGEILLAQDAGRVARARQRARYAGTAVAGFVVGCALGAACEHILGLRSLALPIGVLLIALALGVFAALPQPGSRT
jgi:uncharacterized membrane protein YoaK (UPF0700 family)